MMSLSKVIKQSTTDSPENEVFSVDSSQDGSEASGFLNLGSLWRDSEGGLAPGKARNEQLQHEADEIIRNAENRAVQIEKDAYEKGFAEGLAKGTKDGNDTAAEKIQQVEKLLVEIRNERELLYVEYEKEIFEFVKMVVDKIVNHEVSVNPEAILSCVKNSLKYVIENSKVKVHLNSKDFSKIKEAVLEDPELLKDLSRLELVEDQAISEGGCLLETGFGEVDATLENRKEKIVEAIDRSFLQGLREG